MIVEQVLTGKADTIVDVVIDDGSMIKGYLAQYTISHKAGELETIYLTNAQRYSKSKSLFVNIPGDCFTIMFDKVVDMNITYNQIKPNLNTRKVLRRGLNILGYFALIFLIVYPWYLDVRVINKLTGIICSPVSWLLTLAVLSFKIDPSSNPKMTKQAVNILLVLVATFIFFTLLLYGLIRF
jgi:hypothetical protein